MTCHTFKEFFGPWPLQDLFAQEIDTVFVEPALVRISNQMFNKPKSSEDQGKSESFTALEALHRATNLLMVAPIGMGKTLTLQQLALQILEDPVCQEQGWKPVYMSLATLMNCQSDQEKWKALEKRVHENQLEASQDKWILLLDGLDEVGPDMSGIDVFIQAAQASVAKMVVATRPLPKSLMEKLSETFEEYVLVFDKSHQRDLIQKLCDNETARQVIRYLEVYEINHFQLPEDKHPSYLFEKQSKKTFLGYPLILSWLCWKFNRASVQAEEGGAIDAFENQTELMGFLTRQLAGFRQHSPRLKEHETPEQALSLLRWLALWMRSQDQQELHDVQAALNARYRIREAFPLNEFESRWTQHVLSESDCHLLMATLAQLTGLLIPSNHHRYAFLQDSFVHVLAAEFLNDLTLEEKLYFIESKGLLLKKEGQSEAPNYSHDAPQQDERFELVPPLPANWRLGTVLNRSYDLDKINALEWPETDLPGIHFRRPPTDLKSVSLFPWMYLWDKRWLETLSFLVGLDPALFQHLRARTLEQLHKPIHSWDSRGDYQKGMMACAYEARQCGAEYCLEKEYSNENTFSYLEWSKVNPKYIQESLLADLVDSDEDRQRNASFILWDNKISIAPVRLWQVLKSPQILPETRVDLATKLYESGDSNWLLAIEELLDNTEFSTYFCLNLHFESPRPYGPQALIAILQDPNVKPFLKNFAAEEVTLMISASRRQNYQSILKNFAAKEMALLTSPEMYQTLLDCLMDDQLDSEIRINAAHGLAQFKEIPATALHLLECINRESTPYKLVMQAVFTLGLLQNPVAIDPLMSMLNDSQNTIDLRCEMMRALAKISLESSFETLIHCLQDPLPEIRTEAVSLLIQSKDEEALKRVQRYLEEIWLVEKGQTEFSESFLSHMVIFDFWYDACLTPVFLEWFHTSAPEKTSFRNDCLRIASQYMTPELLETLMNCFHDSDPKIRNWAATALGRLDHKEAIGPLFQLLRDPVYSVRKAAENALLKLTSNGLSIFAKVLALCESDPNLDLQGFWNRLSVEEIAILFEPLAELN